MKKKFFAVVLIGLLLAVGFVLTSCGDNCGCSFRAPGMEFNSEEDSVAWTYWVLGWSERALETIANLCDNSNCNVAIGLAAWMVSYGANMPTTATTIPGINVRCNC